MYVKPSCSLADNLASHLCYRMDLSFALLDGILRAEGIIDLGVEPVRTAKVPLISSVRLR